MNNARHDLSQAVHLLDNHIGYSQRVPSPDSDSSSITSSVFSSDGKSSQGSPQSSPVKSERSWSEEDADRSCKETCQENSADSRRLLKISELVHQVNTEPRPDISRQNPRRTQSAAQSSVCQTQSRCPPQLTRQCDRAQNFVEQLVDTSMQMIEVIWPLSVTNCDKDYLGGNNIIGLRHFIQEVLKRSKTSYYTLQVALYYLVLIKPCITKLDSASQPSGATLSQRAMQCGRRMFLAALILASKYLQDRNYSSRAWSRISGLTIPEINSNEMAFLTAVNWKLHIPENQFARWTNIIYKYSSAHSSSLSSTLGGSNSNEMTWRNIIPRLTPELDEVDIEKFSRLSIKTPPRSLFPQPMINITRACSSPDGDKTPTPATAKLAPAASSSYPNPPYSPRIPALPTPAMTPHMNGFCPPAVKSWSLGQTMRCTMSRLQQEAFESYSQESWPNIASQPKKPLARVLSNVSMISSPESMVSDITQASRSSRSSRSSSISSTVSVRAQPTCLGSRFANYRSALASLNGSGYGTPCVMQSKFEAHETSDSIAVGSAEMDATLALINLSRPKDYMTARSLPKPDHGQKRARPLSIADNSVPDEVRLMLSKAYSADENAVVPDSFEADSFVLSQPHLVKNEMHQTVTSNSQAGARKRQRSGNRASSQLASEINLTSLPYM